MGNNTKVGASCSMGRVAYKHDIRKSLTPNINPDFTHDNVVLIDLIADIPIVDEKGKTRTTEERIEAFINKRLDPYIEEYNQKQKRKDRKIKEEHYCDWHRKQGNKSDKMVYEFVMQYGTRDDLGKRYYAAESQEEKAEIRNEFLNTYKNWLQQWQKEHPQMEVLWCVAHFDEPHGTPHIHVAVLPLGHFDQKLSVQVSMSKCLENEGFQRLATKKEGYQLTRAFRSFREHQEQTLKDLGYEIKAPGQNRPHLDKDQYIAEQQYQEQISKNIALSQENQVLVAENTALYEEISELKEQLADFKAEKRKEEAELEVMKVKTESELYKERRLLKKEARDLPQKDLFGRQKVKEYPGGKYLTEFRMGEYDGLVQQIDHLSSGIKEISKTDIAGQEQLKSLETLVNNEVQYIHQEAENLAREILAKDKERVQENARKEKELQAKEIELVQREQNLVETIRSQALEMLEKALGQGVLKPLADFVMEYFPQVWQQYEAHQEREKMFAEQHIQQQNISHHHRGR